MPDPIRIGLLLPHTDTTLEWDLQRIIGTRCSIHAERLFLENVSVEAEVKMLENETPRAVPFLKPLNPALTVFGCTSAGALYGAVGEKAFTTDLSRRLGCPVVSAFGSVLADLQQARITRLAVFTPYSTPVHAKVADGLRETGMTLAWEDCLGLSDDTDIGRVTPKELLAYFETHAPQAGACEALFLSCTNLRAAETAPELSARLGLPVFSSNLAIIHAIQQTLAL
jgi:maleate isomerase